MKTRLLKKVRKRYVIKYFPKQFIYFDDIFVDGEYMVLYDKKKRYVMTYVKIEHTKVNIIPTEFSARTKELAKIKLMKKLVDWINSDYQYTRKPKTNQIVETIWYNRK